MRHLAGEFCRGHAGNDMAGRNTVTYIICRDATIAMKGDFRRLKGILFHKSCDGYATALSLAFVVALSAIISIRFNSRWLQRLATSVLDLSPGAFSTRAGVPQEHSR